MGALLRTLAAVLAVAAALRLCLSAVPTGWAEPEGGVPRFTSDEWRLSLQRPPTGEWILLLGGSGAGAAVDLHGLPEEVVGQTMWWGRALDVASTLEWTLAHLPAARRPRAVVWGANLVSFARRPDLGPAWLSPPWLAFPDEGIAGRVGGRPLARGILEADCGAVTRARYLLGRADPWFERRESVQMGLARGFRALLFRGDGLEPPMERLNLAETDPSKRRRATEALAAVGLFGEDPFDSVEVRAAGEIASSCARRGIPLLLFACPEHSEHRARYHPKAREAFFRLLGSLGAPVLDLFEAIPDEGFLDQGHVNRWGRPVAMEALVRFLREQGY